MASGTSTLCFKLLRGWLSHIGLVLAAMPHTEPVVLDMGAAVAALRSQSRVACYERPRAAVLPAVLVRLPLVRHADLEQRIRRSRILRFHRDLDRICSVVRLART